jgi:hypothetical protein
VPLDAQSPDAPDRRMRGVLICEQPLALAGDRERYAGGTLQHESWSMIREERFYFVFPPGSRVFRCRINQATC